MVPCDNLPTNQQEVYHAKRRALQPILLSSVPVNAAKDIRPKPASGEVTASFTVIRNLLKN
jgi:hypothetical protein